MTKMWEELKVRITDTSKDFETSLADKQTYDYVLYLMEEIEKKHGQSESYLVSIPQEEYDKLKEEVAFLECLRACGVDNWEAYSEARTMMRESIS